MFCNKCGKENPNNQNFCAWCGNPLVNQQTNNVANNSMVQNNQPIQPVQPVQPINVPINNGVPGTINVQPAAPVQPMTPPKKKSGCLKFLIILVVIIAGIFILFSLIFKDKDETTITEFTKDYRYLAMTNQNELIINGAKENITFYVTSDTTYTITDSKGNLIPTTIQNNQIVNENNYTKGETYTLTLQSGQFVSNQLSGSNKVTFKIERDEVQKYKFQDNLIKVKESDIKVSQDETSFTSNKTYKVGDVIAVNEKNLIREAYVVTAVNAGTYQIRKAQLNEIYSELNFYVEQPADLSDYEVAEEIEEYVTKSIVESPWYASIVEEVNAAPKIKIDINLLDNGIEAEATLEIEANDSSPLVVTKYHNLELVITNRIMVNQLLDITLTNWDVEFDITTEQEFELKIKNEEVPYGKAFKEKQINKELVKKVQKALENAEYTDTSNQKMDVATVDVPTPVPCLTIEIDLKLANELKTSIELGFKVGQTNNVVAGFDYGLTEEFKPISSTDHDYKGIEVSLTGTIENKWGLELSITAEILNTVEAGFAFGTGVYIKSSTGVTAVAAGNDNQFQVGISSEVGLYLEGKLVAEFLGTEAEFVLFSIEHALASDSIEFVYPELEESTEQQPDQDENGIIISNQTNRLEKYSCVDSLEDDSFVKVKFIYENGELKNVEEIGQFYINTGVDFVDSLLNIFVKVVGVMFFIENWIPVEFYEEGYYTYLKVTFTKEQWIEQMEASGYEYSEDPTYNDFKVSMTEEGYVCK